MTQYAAKAPTIPIPFNKHDKVALELDWYLDWSVNDNFVMSFIAAVAEPGDAVEQSSGRTDSFLYGMIYGAYSF